MRLTLARRMPITNNKRRKERNYNLKFSNYWHIHSELVVKDQGYRAACESRGIVVHKAEDLLRPYLPQHESPGGHEEDYWTKNPTVLPELKKNESHPFYNERPAYTFNFLTRLIKGQGLEQAKTLTNTVEIESGLPKRLSDSVSKMEKLLPNRDELIAKVLLNARVFDATQKKLPVNKAVPNIGWNVVRDKMHRDLPYPEGDFSWGWNARREYGIPVKRKNLAMIKGMFNVFDGLSSDVPSLLRRVHLDSTMLRQFFERNRKLVRVYSPMDFLVADEEPLEPYADENQVDKTAILEVPDLHPLNCFSYLFEEHVYRLNNNFPIKESFQSSEVQPLHLHTCFEFNNSHLPLRIDTDYHGRSLIMAFGAALGQARQQYGPDVSGRLPKPITINFVNTNGVKFHLCAFQLNTLDLDCKASNVKNIFWHEAELQPLFDACDYVLARPTIKSYNPEVVVKLMAMYLQNAK